MTIDLTRLFVSFFINTSSLPLFGFASAASRESSVQAANKASQATPNNVAPAGSVMCSV
ncbi:hypothetical protein [Rheinheimera sp. NSM]|uniref:hypothetical protein n=1 Tax=Rheinheimera sp. NSM TaxID=3457884 RepID=UPI0040362CC0